MNTFDKNLKRLRMERKLKQEELAERLNVTRQTVSGWETGRRQPDLDMLQKLAEVLEVDIHELIYGNKPGAYPMYQRKYVAYTSIFGSLAAVSLLFRLLILPGLRSVFNSHHCGAALMLCDFLLPQLGAVSFGALFPVLVQLFIPVRMKKGIRFCCLAAGLAALLPVLLFCLGIPPCSRWVLYKIGNVLLLHILPAISGICMALGTITDVADQH